jgi:hypothetical protein
LRGVVTSHGLCRPHRLSAVQAEQMATSTPKAAPAASRFITAATAGMSRLRKASISSRNPKPRVTAMKISSLWPMTVAKSPLVAVMP